MADDDKNIMIGDLLVRSGLISSADLTEAMQVSRRLGMPMGRVLTMDGRISPDIFQLALEAQSIIRDGLVPPDVGIEALTFAARERQPIHEALKRMDRHPQAKGSTNRLGELLVDAHIITTDQLDQALKISVETGLPLGGTLVTQGIIHASLLPTVLRAQEQIRDGVLPRQAAIEELKAAMKIWSKAEAAMKRTDYASEQPVKPSTVMSTLRETLEGVPQPAVQPQPQQQPVPAHAPQPQHSQLHAQLQQQQYYQNQQPPTHPMQLQQTQPMQMPQPMPPHMQQPMPPHMQQPMPPHMQQPMPPHMQQPMPPHMQQPMPPHMQPPMPPHMPAPIYGYNTPYGHAPYGGPAPDDPWGSWHGTVPRHHGLGVPLPGFPQPPSMPPEGYAPPPGYQQNVQQVAPQVPPQQQNWQQHPAQQEHPAQQQHAPVPVQQAPMLPPPQPAQPPVSNLHAQLQQQQTYASPQPAPDPQPAAPENQQPHRSSYEHAAPASQPSPPAPTPPPVPSPSPAPISPTPPPAPAPIAQSAPPAKPEERIETPKDEGQLKNAAAQLASRLGWAAPRGSDGDAAADLPSPKKLSWTAPQQPVAEEKAPEPIVSKESKEPEATKETKPEPAPEPVKKESPEPKVELKPEPKLESKQEPATAPPVPQAPAPFSSPPPAPVSIQVSSEMTKPFVPESKPAAEEKSPPGWSALPTPTPARPGASNGTSIPSGEFKNPFDAINSAPVAKEAPATPPAPPEPVTEPPVQPAAAAPVESTSEQKHSLGFELELELPKEKPIEEIIGEIEERKVAEITESKNEITEKSEEAAKEDEDEDDEPDFEIEIDLELPAPFNKPVEQLKQEQEKKEQEKKAQDGQFSPVPEPVQKQEAMAPLPPPPPPTMPVQKPVGVPISMPIEPARPGQVAGFGKGTKISLKSDYAPSDTGRLFAITQADALTLLNDDADLEPGDEKKEAVPSKGKKGKNKASQSQTKLAKQQAKGKKGAAGKSQTGLPSVAEPDLLPAWLPQKHQNHLAAGLGKKSTTSTVPDFIEDLLPVTQQGADVVVPMAEMAVSGPANKASSTYSKMASIKQRAVSLSVSNLLPVPLEIAEAQAELAYIVEHRGVPATPPVTFTPAPPPPAPPPVQDSQVTIVELFTLAGFFSKKDIAAALDKALEDSSLAPDLLFALGLVSDDILDVVVRCQALTRNRYLTTEQAIYVLGAVRSGRLSFEEALSEIGK